MSATRLLVELGDLDFKRVVHMLDEIGCSDALPVDFVGAVAIVAAVGVVARGHDESKKYMKERRWADRHQRSDLYKFANRAF